MAAPVVAAALMSGRLARVALRAVARFLRWLGRPLAQVLTQARVGMRVVGHATAVEWRRGRRLARQTRVATRRQMHAIRVAVRRRFRIERRVVEPLTQTSREVLDLSLPTERGDLTELTETRSAPVAIAEAKRSQGLE
jgi:hypothetical protein